MNATISPQRRQEIIDALRRGTVPQNSLDAFAVGLEKFQTAFAEELNKVEKGGAVFKAVRGEYGCGKTFFSRWLADAARKKGFATSEVQISETETPLHRLETVYRRLMERLATASAPNGALRHIIDAWFFALEEDVLAEGTIAHDDTNRLMVRTDELLEQRLARVSEQAPAFASALRGYRKSVATNDRTTADALLAWVSGQPNVASSARRVAGVRGDIDHFGALGFLQGMLIVLRDSGHPGLLVVLDEVETLQRVRSDARDKGLNALRQLLDEIDGGRFPGLFLMITGTPAFFDGPQGIRRLEPLAQRLHVDFLADDRFDNPRAVQIRLPAFTMDRLVLVGCRVRDIYAQHSTSPTRIATICDDEYVRALAAGVTGKLGGKIGVAPRIFLKKLVGDVLDRVDQYAAFDPRKDYPLTISEAEMTTVERQASGAAAVDDIELEI